MYADGSTSNGVSFGAWLVMNNKVGFYLRTVTLVIKANYFNKETYFGGPLHSDLTVDGIGKS